MGESPSGPVAAFVVSGFRLKAFHVQKQWLLVAKGVENTENHKEEKYHLQSYHPEKKKSLMIFWYVSSQTFLGVYMHIKRQMFYKIERIPTFITCPMYTRYSSRHFEYIISESYNNPAKKIHIKY